ncbi:hypothetical protein BDQ17DRAFT_281308, partial [Cyathus striatus]
MTSEAFPKSYTLLSNNNTTQECSVFVGIVVNGVLDVEKLRSAHEELVSLWPAVGGELVTSTKPYSFTSGSIVDFGSRYLQKIITDIPELVDFSNANSEKVTYHNISSQTDKIFHFDTMEKFPPPPTLLAIRVTALEDATLLGFRLSHHLFDGQGTFNIVKAYADVINGNLKLIPRLIPPSDIHTLLSGMVEGEDSLPPSVNPNNPYVHPKANYTLGFIGLFMFIWITLLNMSLAKIGVTEREMEKCVHIPGELVELLRERCQEELNNASERGELKEGSGLHLTKNDVITAWFIKSAYDGLSPSPTQTIDLMYKLNYCPFITLPPEGTQYLHNSFYGMRIHYPSLSQVQSSPLSRIALEIRLCCIRNKQPSAIRTALKFWEDNVKSFIIPKPPDVSLTKVMSFMPLFGSWTTFEYNKLDFGGGLKAGHAGGDGRVVFTQPCIALPMHATVKPTAVLLKDGKGGYWLRANLWES